MRTIVNSEVFNRFGADPKSTSPAARAWRYWAKSENHVHFTVWLKKEFNLDLIRHSNGRWEISGEEKDATMFILRFS